MFEDSPPVDERSRFSVFFRFYGSGDRARLVPALTAVILLGSAKTKQFEGFVTNAFLTMLAEVTIN